MSGDDKASFQEFLIKELYQFFERWELWVSIETSGELAELHKIAIRNIKGLVKVWRKLLILKARDRQQLQ